MEDLDITPELKLFLQEILTRLEDAESMISELKSQGPNLDDLEEIRR